MNPNVPHVPSRTQPTNSLRNVNSPRGKVPVHPLVSPRNGPMPPPRRNPLISPRQEPSKAPIAPPRKAPSRKSERPPTLPPHPSGNPLVQPKPPTRNFSKEVTVQTPNINISQNIPRSNERRVTVPTMVAMPSSQANIKNARKVPFICYKRTI